MGSEMCIRDRVNTVEFHRKQIMLKLEAKNASDMLIKAIKSGVLEI